MSEVIKVIDTIAPIELDKNFPEFQIEINNAYLNKLKGKFFGLLREREKDREWEKFLDNILIELGSFPLEKRTINYEIICRKMSIIKYLRFKYFRTVILECMNLLGTLEE